VVAVLGAPEARASCSYINGYAPQNYTLQLPSTISVPRNAVPGQILANINLPANPAVTPFASCNGGNATRTLSAPTVAAGSIPYVYQTNVPGIGLAFYDYWPSQAATRYWGYTGSQEATGTMDWTWNSTLLGVQVVVTGPVSGGSVTNVAGVTANFAIAGLQIATLQAVGHPSIIVVACTTPNVTVNMGNHRLSEMAAVGSTTSSTSFNILLNSCPSGLNGITYELDPTTTIVAGTGNSVVTLDGSSTASGVGLQVLDGNGNPFALGTPVTFTGYNQSTGGNYAIPLKARYYRTTSAANVGSANTAITFIMTYQ